MTCSCCPPEDHDDLTDEILATLDRMITKLDSAIEKTKERTDT